MLGEVLSAAGAPLLYFVVSRVLGAEILGTYILVTYYVALFLRLAVFGFDRGVLRYIPLARSSENARQAEASVLGTALRWTAGLSIGIAGFVYLFPGIFVKVGGNEDALDLHWWLAVLVLALPGQAISKVVLYAIRGLSNMWAFVIVQNIVAPVSLTVLSLAPLLFDQGPRYLAIGFLGSAYLSMGVALSLLKRNFPLHSLRDLLRSKRDIALLKFSYPQAMSETLTFLLSRIDVIMLAAFFPDKPEWVAFYGLSALIASLVKKVRFSFDTSFSPVFADLHATGDRQGMQHQFRTVGHWIFELFVPAAGAIVLSSKFILSIYGPDFTDFWLVVPILSFGRLFNTAGGPGQATLLMAGHSRLELANTVVTNIINVALNLILIPKYHVFGAAIATSTALTICNVARIVELAVFVKVWVNPVKVLKIFAAGVTAAAPSVLVLWLVSSEPLVCLASAVGFLILYPPCLMVFGGGDEVKAAWAIVTGKLFKGGR
jgi:O-antigen/teichoic acid export membrane protein